MSEEVNENKKNDTEYSMYHLNSNCLCALDIKVTGPDVINDDIYEICIVPLDYKYDPVKQYLPFFTQLNPIRVDMENVKKSKDRVMRAKLEGMDPDLAINILEDWKENRLKIKNNKGIMVVTYDWPRKLPYLVQWLGQKTFDYLFHWSYRDILAASLYDNDYAYHRHVEIPYPKNYLSYLIRQCKIEKEGSIEVMDCFMRCHLIAQTYKAMMSRSIGTYC